MKGIKNNSGFSLIELMAVLVIISLLVAFALPSFQKTTSFASLKSIQTALNIAHLKVSRCYYNQLEKDIKEQCNFDYENIKLNSTLKDYLVASTQNDYEIELKIVSKTEFDLIATLKNNEESDCYKLSLNQDGIKESFDENNAKTEKCWK